MTKMARRGCLNCPISMMTRSETRDRALFFEQNLLLNVFTMFSWFYNRFSARVAFL